MSVMNFNTSNETFRKLLGNGMRYRVPPFQRDYSWTDNEWDDLWQDIVAMFEDDGEPAHYMGYLVLQSSDAKQFDIIDGQQRITTISVLLLAGLSYLQDLASAGIDADNNLKRQSQLQSSYIGYVDPVTLVSHPKLELNRHNNNFYQTYLVPLEKLPKRRLNASEHQLRKAFDWFKEQLTNRFSSVDNSGTEFALFIDGLVDKLFFTVITVTDELNAFKVFETLNARGVQLSATDLLKNYLFSIVSSASTHENEIKALEDRWERIVGLLGDERFSEFLRVFWNSHHRLTRKTELFKVIRKDINSRAKAFQLLRDMDQGAEVYIALRDPHDPQWSKEEKAALEDLQLFNVRQPLAMLMASYLAFYEQHRPSFTRILQAVAVISFRYNVICNLQSNEQERLYNEVARGISDGSLSTLKMVLSALSAVYPEDKQFKASFAEKELRTTNSRNKKVVRYILFAIENQKSGEHYDGDSKRYNLEHILPENPDESWSAIDDEKHERLVYRLANMTPMEVTSNRAMGNQSFEIKCQAFAESGFEITRSIAEHYDTWGEKEIGQRQSQLAKLAVGIWRLDLG